MVVGAGSVMSGRLVVLFPVFFTLFLFAVFVVQIAASRAGNSSKSGTGKGILIEDGGADRTGGNADGRTGGEMLFLRGAGGESKGKDGYGESGKESVHVFLGKADVVCGHREQSPLSFLCDILIQDSRGTVTPGKPWAGAA